MITDDSMPCHMTTDDALPRHMTTDVITTHQDSMSLLVTSAGISQTNGHTTPSTDTHQRLTRQTRRRVGGEERHGAYSTLLAGMRETQDRPECVVVNGWVRFGFLPKTALKCMLLDNLYPPPEYGGVDEFICV